MINVEISQASLPLTHVFLHSLADQQKLVEEAELDGIEAQLTRSYATWQLTNRTLGPEKEIIHGIHASARSESLGLNPKEWPRTKFALQYTLAMLHNIRSLSRIDPAIEFLGNPDLHTILYPLPGGEEGKVTKGKRLFQIKGEVMLQRDLMVTKDLNTFLEENPEWQGYVHDIQHSLTFLPTMHIKKVPGVVRGHLSLDRTDIEKWDRRISSRTIAKGIKDDVVYPWVMELAALHDDMVYVLETPPPKVPSNEWREHKANIAWHIRHWTK